MPSPNIVKQFVEGGIYHVYNLGALGQPIFLDAQDYEAFLNCLRFYLADEYDGKRKPRRRSMAGRLDLVAYCLAENHFHLMVQQYEATAMSEFMRCVTNAYMRYFNGRYNRRGSLFAGKYRAALLETEEQVIHLSRYLHLHTQGDAPSLVDYPYSSYAYYLRKVMPIWINPTAVWEHFYYSPDYRQFMEGQDVDSAQVLGRLTMEASPAGAGR